MLNRRNVCCLEWFDYYELNEQIHERTICYYKRDKFFNFMCIWLYINLFDLMQVFTDVKKVVPVLYLVRINIIILHLYEKLRINSNNDIHTLFPYHLRICLFCWRFLILKYTIFVIKYIILINIVIYVHYIDIIVRLYIFKLLYINNKLLL